jgi:DNA primase
MQTSPRGADHTPGRTPHRAPPAPGGRTAASAWEIDVGAVLRRHNLVEIVARYGIALHRSGRNFVGRCPFHLDRGRPNLCIFTDTASYYCFRCAAHGDAITFIREMEGVGFREAVARLDGGRRTPQLVPAGAAVRGQAPREPVTDVPRGHERPAAPLGPAERDCLQAASELYHNRLLGDPAALDYIRGRGVDRPTIVECRVGFAAGDELATTSDGGDSRSPRRAGWACSGPAAGRPWPGASSSRSCGPDGRSG